MDFLNWKQLGAVAFTAVLTTGCGGGGGGGGGGGRPSAHEAVQIGQISV